MMKRVLLLCCFFLLALSASAQLFDAKKSYEISTPDGWVLDAAGAVQTDTPLVLSRREAGNASQVWQIRPLGKGAYQLVNGHSGTVFFRFLGRSTQMRKGNHASHIGDGRRREIGNIMLDLSLFQSLDYSFLIHQTVSGKAIPLRL